MEKVKKTKSRKTGKYLYGFMGNPDCRVNLSNSIVQRKIGGVWTSLGSVF